VGINPGGLPPGASERPFFTMHFFKVVRFSPTFFPLNPSLTSPSDRPRYTPPLPDAPTLGLKSRATALCRSPDYCRPSRGPAWLVPDQPEAGIQEAISPFPPFYSKAYPPSKYSLVPVHLSPYLSLPPLDSSYTALIQAPELPARSPNWVAVKDFFAFFSEFSFLSLDR